MSAAPSSVRVVEGEARHFGAIDLIARLGQGGMAEVFLAAHRERPAELIVLKRLKADLDDPEHRAMFDEEARIMPLFSHPNVVRTTDVGEEAGRRYLAMEFLDGLPLDQCAATVSGLGERAAIHLACEMLDGLHYAHELRDGEGASLELVHRDVSPHNVFITYEGRVTLVDFGIAKTRGRAQQTATGVVRGKLSYMAPEQALCDALDRRADVFAAGVILWELVVGRPFWDGLSEVQILKRMTFGDLPKIRETKPDVSEALATVLERAITVKPEDRYATARAFRDALIPLRDGSFRRTALGNAVADQAKDYRAALRELVDRHLEEARGTAGLPGISMSEAPSLRSIDEPKRDRVEAVDAPVPSSRAAVTLEPVIESPSSLADSGTFAPSSVRAQGSDRFMTETGAATIVEVSPRRRRRARSWVAGALALGAIVALGAFVVPRFVARSQASGAPSEGGARAAGEESTRIELKLTVSPKGATVHLDDMQIDRNPFAASFPKDKAGHKLTVEAPGFITKSQVVVFDRDLDLSITLVPSEEATKPGHDPDSEAVDPPASVAQAVGSGKAVRRPYRPATPSSSAARTPPAPPPAASTGFVPAGDPWKRNGTKKKP